MSILDVDRNLKYFFVLYKLAEIGALVRTVKVSTNSLAKRIGISQQTVSRHLIELDRIGWIQRTTTHDGSFIRISSIGESQLKRIHFSFDRIFEEKHSPFIAVEGTVFSGLGEGAYYITQKMYRRQFVKKLDFDPYPGTLNLKATSEYDAKMCSELDANPGIEIKGFTNKKRTYGSVKCFKVLINNKEKGAVIRALRSHYDSSIIEIISPVCLRKCLNLKNGDKVKLDILITKP